MLERTRDIYRTFSVMLYMLALCGLVLTTATAARASAHAQESYEAQRQHAMQIYDQNKFTEAVPLFEKLFAQKPDDVAVVSRLGFSLYASSAAIKDPELKRQARVRARTLLLRANELGDNSDLTRSTIEALLANEAGDVSYSNRQEADAAMKEGEEAFVKGDFPKALAAYERALKADPKLYEAALFMGDVYFKSQRPEQAGQWFARAISIDPDRETAYRYWGDSLLGEGKIPEAREKFIEAYLAEPYNRSSAAGLNNLAARANLRLAHPKVEIPTSVSALKDGKMTINIDPKAIEVKNGGSAWMMYGLSRATWPTGEFAKRFPNESAYRHSLPEEAEALAGVAELAASQLKEKKIKNLDPSLANLIRLHADGLLEAYVLLGRPDRGIAQDYASYRRTNKDKLRRYVLEYVLTNGGSNK
jgi:tetratricopeptide (TPR) repeat protein